MLSFVAGTDLSIEVPFLSGVDSFVPDVGSVTYTVRDNAGAPISGYVNIPVTTTTSTTSILVPVLAAANGKATSFENRTVTVKFAVNGQTSYIDKKYRLIDRINHTLDFDSLRSLVGLAPNELPDDDLDISMGYYLAAVDIGKAVLDAALIAGTTLAYAANRAIACKTLLEALPSLSLRVLASERSQTAGAARMPNLDLKKVERWLTDIYARAQLTLSGNLQGSLPLLVLATPVDAITGV